MKQIINQEKLTHGLFKIIYSDGSMEYRSVEYTYEYPQFTKNEKLCAFSVYFSFKIKVM